MTSHKTSKVNVCKSLCPALKSLWIFQCTAEKLHAFYFSKVVENSTWVPLFTELNENPEPLKIKICVWEPQGKCYLLSERSASAIPSGGNLHCHSNLLQTWQDSVSIWDCNTRDFSSGRKEGVIAFHRRVLQLNFKKPMLKCQRSPKGKRWPHLMSLPG